METVRISPVWIGLLGASILCDVVATAYLKWAGDRFSENFFLANVLSIALFAPAIVTFGYALREGPSPRDDPGLAGGSDTRQHAGRGAGL